MSVRNTAHISTRPRPLTASRKQGKRLDGYVTHIYLHSSSFRGHSSSATKSIDTTLNARVVFDPTQSPMATEQNQHNAARIPV